MPSPYQCVSSLRHCLECACVQIAPIMCKQIALAWTLLVATVCLWVGALAARTATTPSPSCTPPTTAGTIPTWNAAEILLMNALGAVARTKSQILSSLGDLSPITVPAIPMGSVGVGQGSWKRVRIADMPQQQDDAIDPGDLPPG